MDTDVAQSIMWLALAFLCVAVGAGLGYLFWRAGRMVLSMDELVSEVGEHALPVVDKLGVGMDTVNSQLHKVDIVMDSAVDVAQQIDTSVRAVSFAVTEPVRQVSGMMAGMGAAAGSFRAGMAEDGGGDDGARP